MNQQLAIFVDGKPVGFTDNAEITYNTEHEEEPKHWVSDNVHTYEWTGTMEIKPWSEGAKTLRRLAKIKATCEYEAKRLPRKKKKQIRKILEKCGWTNYKFKFIEHVRNK